MSKQKKKEVIVEEKVVNEAFHTEEQDHEIAEEVIIEEVIDEEVEHTPLLTPHQEHTEAVLDLSGEIPNDEHEEKEDIVEEKGENQNEDNPILIEVIDPDSIITKPYRGVVINTSKLNVRKHPSLEAEIVHVLNKKDTVTIDPVRNTKNFYHVTITLDDNKGVIEGYCVKDYVVG